jgi:WD40 repeat protein/transcriptional regulator with XRE-family HTH domain
VTTTDVPTGGADSSNPDEIATAEEFGAALTQLRERAGLSIRQVARATNIPNATLGGYFSGRHLPPPTQPQVLTALLDALGVEGGDHATWRDATIRLRRLPGPRSTQTPYRGLESYRVEDAALFVGREEQVDAVLALVNSHDLASRCIAVVGPSGCGKSSLLHAGVMAKVRENGMEAVSLDPTASTADLAELSRRPIGNPTLVVLDQFEQTLADDVDPGALQALIEQIELLAARPDTTVLLGLRADFYARALLQPELIDLLRHQVPLGALTREQLTRIIEEPAARLSQPMEPAFVNLILRDVAPRHALVESTRLPLVSHALLMTWEHGKKRGLTAASYAAIGGVAGAVQATAEAAYASLSDPEKEAARRLFNLMIILDADGLAMRRTAQFSDIKSDTAIVDAAEVFVAHRILTATSTGYAISHESLTRAWPRLAEWLESDQELLRTRRRLATSAANWDENGRRDDGLIRGDFLADASALAESSTILTSAEADLVRASSAAQTLERNKARRSRRRLVLIAVCALVLAIATTTLSGVLVRARNDLVVQRNDALSRQVAVESALLRPTDPALSAQLAVEAYRLAATPEARSAVLEATGEREVTRLLGAPGPMRVAPSPTGKLIAIADAAGRLRIYRPHAGAAPSLLSTTAVDKGQLYALAWSPDGGELATGGSAGNVSTYRVDASGATHHTGTLVAGNGVENVHYNADGSVLYAATGAGLHRWQRTNSAFSPLPSINGFGGTVNDVALSPKGLAATASSDGVLRLWAVHGNTMLLQSSLSLGAPNVFAFTVAFSPDGRYLAEGEKDKIAHIYDVSGKRPRLVKTLTGFPSWVTSIAFSPDGTEVTAGASGGVVQTWQTASWTREQAFHTPSNVTAVMYTGDGNTLLLGTVDGTAFLTPADGNRPPVYGDNIWNLDTSPDGRTIYLGVGSVVATVPSLSLNSRQRPTPDPVAFTGPASAGKPDGSVSSSRDGRWIASGTSTGEVLLWSAKGPRAQPFVLPAASQLIETTRFSPDGRLLAATADDGTITLFDVSGATPHKTAQLHVKTLALNANFSPDSALIAVAGADNLVHVFRISSGHEVATLHGFTNYVYGVAFSPDGRYLAASSTDKTARIWDLSNLRSPRLLPKIGTGPTDTVYSVAWNRSGTELVGGSQDGTIWLWQVTVQGLSPYAHIGNMGAGVTDALFLPNGAIIATGLQGTVDAWAGEPVAAANEICSRAGSPITRQEWDLYVPGVAYRNPCS